MRLLIVMLVWAAVFAAGPARAAGIDFGRYHALVIGNNEYEHLPRLQTAVSDAGAVAEVLRLKYGFDVQLLINATRQQILRAMNRYRADLTEQDNLLVYYAGHGYLDHGSNTGFWQPVDAEADDDLNWIANDDLTRRFNAMSVRHVMVVADSCYSGTLVRSSTGQLPTGAEREPWLRRMSERRSRTAIVSGGLEPVADTGKGGHSVFANAFLGILRESADILDGQALAQGVTQKVVLNADQTPQYSNIRKAGHEGGEFLFVPKGSALAAAPAAPRPKAGGSDSQAVELALWNAANDSAKPAAYEAYLKQFPNGIFATVARLKIEELKGGAEKPTAPAAPKTAMATPKAPTVGIEEVDESFVTVKNANLRARPTTKSQKVGRLKKGTEVTVTGKVAGGKWYRVEHAGAEAYAYAPLLQDKSAWEEAETKSATEARRQTELAAERRAKEEERRRVEAEARRMAEARRQAEEEVKRKEEVERQRVAAATPPKPAPRGAQIPEKLLSKEYDNCVANSRKNRKNKNVSREQIGKFCLCMKEEVRRRYNVVEYTKRSLEAKSGRLSRKDKKELTEMAYLCAIKSYQ